MVEVPAPPAAGTVAPTAPGTVAPTARRLVERAVLRDGVYDMLVEMLMAGDLAPGTNLSIDGLARDLGVSPTPVREALVHLEHTGLVSRVAMRGYRVAPPLSEREMNDLADARMIIELGALDMALKRRDSLLPLLRVAHQRHVDVVSSLERAKEDADDANRFVNLRHYFQVDWAFHITIIDHAQNEFVHRMADALGSHVHRLRQTVQHGLTDSRDAVTEHRRVLDAMESGGDDDVRRAMRAHIDAVRSRSMADVSAKSDGEVR
jgi:DNA-binding GntR family transcriptional regulator